MLGHFHLASGYVPAVDNETEFAMYPDHTRKLKYVVRIVAAESMETCNIKKMKERISFMRHKTFFSSDGSFVNIIADPTSGKFYLCAMEPHPVL